MWKKDRSPTHFMSSITMIAKQKNYQPISFISSDVKIPKHTYINIEERQRLNPRMSKKNNKIWPVGFIWGIKKYAYN